MFAHRQLDNVNTDTKLKSPISKDDYIKVMQYYSNFI